MLESFAVPSSQNFVLNRIESEFNLGPLGDYINKNVQTLPFLATVMAQIHQQLHIPSNDQKSQNQDPSQAMTSFWVELEEKLGANAKTFSTVEEISENARLAAEDLSKENPIFDSVLTDVKKCIKQAWGSLETEVDYCIRRVKRKRYSDKAMEKIYARLVKKGVQTARQIQDKIESVTTQKRVR
ncbi:Hypothetical protein NTJ_00479 [Nesidiocoris tenuis]|uniref:Uncharacterized protein n=1 Tax=Nesidiocoris tenuis TaxID=355587 RepID=A0ABN7A957_9HEMI|nr:Hypothetical protein NTJ_00479 [Nesidiocoris tenuis]